MALRDLKMCRDCLRYCRERDQARAQVKKLQQENRRLRERLGTAPRTIQEPPFGASTPSAKLPVKPSSPPTRQARKGGAKPGHPGRGRGSLAHLSAQPPERVRLPPRCPHCQAELARPATRTRTLAGCQPPQTFVRQVVLEEAWCPGCRRTVRTQAPGVLPRLLLDNSALAYVAVEHYLHGSTLGRLAKTTGLAKGTLVNALHGLAERFAPVHAQLALRLRQAPVICADETVWRNDGANGYAWMFRTPSLVYYRFCDTRSGQVPKAALGAHPLPGVLVTDRYAGYNGLPVARQFCYAHLLRDLQDLEKHFPAVAEVRRFVAALAPRLAAAMHLRRTAKNPDHYRRRARRLREQIHTLVNLPAHHAAVQAYQDLFRRYSDNLYHWVENPAVPPDNNFAESGLRPTVIARKMSFGSQSLRGAQTREILMSVLGTLACRPGDPGTAFRKLLDQLAQTPPPDLASLLFPEPPSPT